MQRTLISLCLVLLFIQSKGQDESRIKSLFDESLTAGKSYNMLEYLTTTIGQRLSGSPGAAAAVSWGQEVLKDIADTTFLQPVMVPHWVRGAKETGRILSKKRGPVNVNVCALGGSVGTGTSGLSAPVVEVKDFEQLKKLGKAAIQGKIVFFNRPMDASLINAFEAYSGAVDQRAFGAAEAAKYGAVGVIIRSMGDALQDYPHTGMMQYQPDVTKIPAVAIATLHADWLSAMVKEEKDLSFYMETTCAILPDAPSFNVVGELRGSEFPDQYIVVGGHLDSWDLAQGAHDDGTGCVHAIEVLRLFKALGMKPKHTIRVVLFMNEENGSRGALEYARLSGVNREKHIAAIESDAGGFTPRGFGISADESIRKKIIGWKPLLEPYGLTDFNGGSGGADIEPLGEQGVPLLEFLPDPQRYFSYHHTKEDTIDKVNRRELEMGAASIAALVYLIDKYGLGQ